MKCEQCGKELSNNVAFCGNCGRPTSPAGSKVKCRHCNVEISGNLEYCTNCGKPTSSTTVDNKKRSGRNREDDDDEDEGGILGGIGDLVGKLFG
jgi:predicted amidophosphoribosyltransferase